MLNHSDILELVVNIRNVSLRKEILSKQDIDYMAADIIFTIETMRGTTFTIGDLVFLKVDLITQSNRVFQIAQVNKIHLN